MALLQASRSWARPDSNLKCLKSFLISCVHVLHGLPLPLAPSTSITLHLLTGFSFSILSTCPNHLNLDWRIISHILDIPNLFLNSSEDFLSWRVTRHIHLIICISVLAILAISSSFSGQVSLPYNITLLMQAWYNFPLILCDPCRS